MPLKMFFAAMLAVSPLAVSSAVEPEYAADPSRVGSGPFNIYVARTVFTNGSSESIHSVSLIQEKLDQVEEFFRINSYDTVWFSSIEISDPLPVEHSLVLEKKNLVNGELVTNTNHTPVPEATYQYALANLGIDLKEDYDCVLFLHNPTPTGGKMTNGAKGTSVWDGSAVMFFGEMGNGAWSVLAHEIGHNFNLPHARSILGETIEETLPPVNDRVYYAYGDKFTPMGGGQYSYSVIEKYRKGWVENSSSYDRFISKVTVQANPKTRTIYAYDRDDSENVHGNVGRYIEADFGVEYREWASGDTTRDPNREDQRLWISVVSRGPFDRTTMTMPDLAEPVLLLHISEAHNPDGGTDHHTFLLDATPGSNTSGGDKDMLDAGIPLGETASVALADGQTLDITFTSYNYSQKKARVTLDLN